jgi:hypothetical protein
MPERSTPGSAFARGTQAAQPRSDHPDAAGKKAHNAFAHENRRADGRNPSDFATLKA